jgi:hypothetical protein
MDRRPQFLLDRIANGLKLEQRVIHIVSLSKYINRIVSGEEMRFVSKPQAATANGMLDI